MSFICVIDLTFSKFSVIFQGKSSASTFIHAFLSYYIISSDYGVNHMEIIEKVVLMLGNSDSLSTIVVLMAKR